MGDQCLAGGWVVSVLRSSHSAAAGGCGGVREEGAQGPVAPSKLRQTSASFSTLLPSLNINSQQHPLASA